jgi:hypothetical protein
MLFDIVNMDSINAFAARLSAWPRGGAWLAAGIEMTTNDDNFAPFGEQKRLQSMRWGDLGGRK